MVAVFGQPVMDPAEKRCQESWSGPQMCGQLCFFFFENLWQKSTISWWLNQPIWKICSNWIIFPRIVAKVKKYIKPPSQTIDITSTYSFQSITFRHCLPKFCQASRKNCFQRCPNVIGWTQTTGDLTRHWNFTNVTCRSENHQVKSRWCNQGSLRAGPA